MVELRSNGRHSSKCCINKQRASHQSQVYHEMEHHHQWIVKDEPSKKMQAAREETPRRTLTAHLVYNTRNGLNTNLYDISIQDKT